MGGIFAAPCWDGYHRQLQTVKQGGTTHGGLFDRLLSRQWYPYTHVLACLRAAKRLPDVLVVLSFLRSTLRDWKRKKKKHCPHPLPSLPTSPIPVNPLHHHQHHRQHCVACPHTGSTYTGSAATKLWAQELCKSRGGHTGFPQSSLRSCVKVEVAVLGSPSVISPVVSVDIKQHWIGLPVPNSPYGLCGRKAALNSLNNNWSQSPWAVWRKRWTSWAPRS